MRYRGASEICDGFDNNCDLQIDEGVLQSFHIDADLDGYGSSDTPTLSCNLQEGYSANALDCVDSNPLFNPDQLEICDGFDNNCDGNIDESFIDTDSDGIADCVDDDIDGDGVSESVDNCPFVLNPEQADLDGDAMAQICDFDQSPPVLFTNPSVYCGGDLCDLDVDGDLVLDEIEPEMCLKLITNKIIAPDGCALGDVNKDGCYTLTDYQQVIIDFYNHMDELCSLFGTEDFDLSTDEGDFNQDGCVDLLDQSLLIQVLADDSIFDQNCEVE